MHILPYNSGVLGEQMEGLSRAAERRLAELKGRQQELERELYSIDEKTAAAAAAGAAVVSENCVDDDEEEERASVVAAGAGAGEGLLALEQAAREAYLRYKQVREKAAVAAGAEQRARAGLQHVAEILGVLPVRASQANGGCRIKVCIAIIMRCTVAPRRSTAPPSSRLHLRCRCTRWCTRWRPCWTSCRTSWSGSSTRSSRAAPVGLRVGVGVAGCCTRRARGTSRCVDSGHIPSVSTNTQRAFD